MLNGQKILLSVLLLKYQNNKTSFFQDSKAADKNSSIALTEDPLNPSSSFTASLIISLTSPAFFNHEQPNPTPLL